MFNEISSKEAILAHIYAIKSKFIKVSHFGPYSLNRAKGLQSKPFFDPFLKLEFQAQFEILSCKSSKDVNLKRLEGYNTPFLNRSSSKSNRH